MPGISHLWSETDDSILRTMAAEGKLADQIGRRLGRNTAAVKARARVIGVTMMGIVEWRAQRGIRPHGG